MESTQRPDIRLFGEARADVSPDRALLDLNRFINAMPGGVSKCLNDAAFTLLEVSQGFLSLTGYTLEELEACFSGSYLRMVHPEDRDAVAARFKEQASKGSRVEAEYRLLCKGGEGKRVLDRGQLLVQSDGQEVFCCELTDISDLHATREALRLSLKRQKIILEQSTDMVFEWDIRQDTLVYAANWAKKFGDPPKLAQAGLRQLLGAHIHPDDRGAFDGMMDRIQEGAPFALAECRVLDQEGGAAWCRIRITGQFAGPGHPARALGVITDIDEDRRTIQTLRAKAERDALTGLYNKAAFTALVEEHLLLCPPSEACAMLMVDVDNFKTLNDTQGHLFGDAVLAALSAGMKRELRGTDLIGRVGGDEFAIFLKGIGSTQAACKKAERLVAMVPGLFRSDKNRYHISCSIGIALFPAHGRVFQSLYQCADVALYQAKSLGKDRYALYAPEMSLPGQGVAAQQNKQDAGGQYTSLFDDLSKYVIHTLYLNDDFEKAVSLVLEIVGKHFDVSRAYIFENSEDGLEASNTFEWCGEGVKPEKDALQRLSYAELAHYERNFDANGLFYCRDIQELPPPQRQLLQQQGVRSLLQCAIRREGRFYGFIGFDECTGLRLWDQSEVSALALLAELIGAFLLSRRAQDKDRQLSSQLTELLDLQDAYIYVVSAQDYSLLYLNKKARTLEPGTHPEKATCYEVFFNKREPCEYCPIQRQGKTPLQIYNPQYRLWVAAQAAPIQWDGRAALLISCYDITPYQKQSV